LPNTHAHIYEERETHTQPKKKSRNSRKKKGKENKKRGRSGKKERKEKQKEKKRGEKRKKENRRLGGLLKRKREGDAFRGLKERGY